MKIITVQPPYHVGENPDQKIATFLLKELENAEKDCLIILPEYSNAGGLTDIDALKKATSRAKDMLKTAGEIAQLKGCFVVINVLESRCGKFKNSTYLFDKLGKVAFVYDKIHLPPSEVGFVERGNGECFCQIDGIRFGFLTCYDVYFNEQIEYLAMQKPDIILLPGYQRGESADIICAQTKLVAFRCNSYVAKSSYSMNDTQKGGCSMVVAPDGKVLVNMGKETGAVSADIEPLWKYTRSAGFGGEIVRNDDFINNGLCPEIFKK